MSDEMVVFVTAGTLIQARQIAETLVERGLVACANLIPGIESIYRWNGAIQKDSEVLMILKTTRDQFKGVETAVKELHTYETPEVIGLDIAQGSQPYLDWLKANVGMNL